MFKQKNKDNKQYALKLTTDDVKKNTLKFKYHDLRAKRQVVHEGQSAWQIPANELQSCIDDLGEVRSRLEYDRIRPYVFVPNIESVISDSVALISVKSAIDAGSVLRFTERTISNVLREGHRLEQQNKQLNQNIRDLKQYIKQLESSVVGMKQQLQTEQNRNQNNKQQHIHNVEQYLRSTYFSESKTDTEPNLCIDSTDNKLTLSIKALEDNLREQYF